MLNAFLIFVLILLYTFQSFFCKRFDDHYPGNPDLSSQVFSIIDGLIVAFAAFAYAGFSAQIGWLTLVLGIANAAALFFYNMELIRASQNGPYSIMLICLLAGGITIPTFVNVAAGWGNVNLWQILSLVLLFVSVYLVSKKDGESFKDKKVFFLSSALLFLFNGTYGTLLNAQQELTGEEEKMGMIICTFFFSSLFGAGLLFIKTKKDFFPAFRQTKKSALYLILCSIVTGSAVILLVELITRMGDKIAILYTFDNAGVALFSILISAFILKEKLSKANWIGCVLLILSLIGVTVLQDGFLENLFASL